MLIFADVGLEFSPFLSSVNRVSSFNSVLADDGLDPSALGADSLASVFPDCGRHPFSLGFKSADVGLEFCSPVFAGEADPKSFASFSAD